MSLEIPGISWTRTAEHEMQVDIMTSLWTKVLKGHINYNIPVWLSIILGEQAQTVQTSENCIMILFKSFFSRLNRPLKCAVLLLLLPPSPPALLLPLPIPLPQAALQIRRRPISCFLKALVAKIFVVAMILSHNNIKAYMRWRWSSTHFCNLSSINYSH